ncbi:MAG TPA: peptidoglycan-binding domain-containing protein [Candidatus Paceibacterota bacterium]
MKHLVTLLLLLAIPAGAQAVSFERNLKLGDRGEDVVALQRLLNVVPTSGYFGVLTLGAVIKYQESHKAEILTPSGLRYGTGYVGPSTRAFLNQPADRPSYVASANTPSQTSEPMPYFIAGPTMLYVWNFDIYTATTGASVLATTVRPLTNKSVSAIVHWGNVATSSATVSGSKINFAVPPIASGTYQVTFETNDFRTSNPVTFTVQN